MANKPNLDLSKEPLFICYATIMQIWYEDPMIESTVRTAMRNWLHEFCLQVEIDERIYKDFLANQGHILTKMFWHAFLRDVALMPTTASHEAIKVGMKAKPSAGFQPGINVKKSDDDSEAGKAVAKK